MWRRGGGWRSWRKPLESNNRMKSGGVRETKAARKSAAAINQNESSVEMSAL